MGHSVYSSNVNSTRSVSSAPLISDVNCVGCKSNFSFSILSQENALFGLQLTNATLGSTCVTLPLSHHEQVAACSKLARAVFLFLLSVSGVFSSVFDCFWLSVLITWKDLSPK